MAGLLSRIVAWGTGRAAEGQYRPGPYLLSDGWLPSKAGWNFWQSGYNVQGYGGASAMVEACVSAYSQTVAMCPGDHWRKLDNGGRERVTNSALQRIMKNPNDYQNISDFLLNLTRRLYERGEAFAVATRNDRGEIAALHPMREGRAQIAEDGSVFYSLHGNQVIEARLNFEMPVPAREVLHVRLHAPLHPLKGVSPLLAATLDLAMSAAAKNQQLAFYLNQARPSFMLETDAPLKRDQVEALRKSWNDQTQGENAGNSPILTHGLKAKPATATAQDGQLAEMLRMTDQDVALAMRIPLQILGLGNNTYASTELLMQSWIASGLGFTLNHIEEAFGQMFRLRGFPDEYLELDTRALLRSAYRERIEALARGVLTGIYSPDEARAEEDLPAVTGGHGKMPRVQQQVVPLSYGSDLQPPSAKPAASPKPPAAPPAPPTPPAAPPGGNSNAQFEQDAAAARATLRSSYERHRLAA